MKRTTRENRLEHNLMFKIVNYNIKNDLQNYYNNIIENIIEPHTSIKQIKRTLSTGNQMKPCLTD